ncbi:Probable thiol oxidoreductase with 2 cytochrome c heme-binding sites [Pseudoalteromonas luteoviolacea B = ATCC 29581]|nr:Probable thiol oxidoreductase with 2 cytochrome c heme-binding sites [Pseudoalteromonas luteoviolacea B = ATCC 29581]
MNKLPILVLASTLVACGNNDDTTPIPTPETPTQQARPSYLNISLLGGDTTTDTTNNSGHGFSTPMPNLNAQELDLHLQGDTHFEMSFTTAPNKEHPELDGLGPVFNNQNCNACHQRDGRPSTLMPLSRTDKLLLGSNAGIFLRISLDDGECAKPTNENDYCKNSPVPGYGEQLFHRGVLKARDDWSENPFIGQASVWLSYEYSTFNYPDGTSVELRKPVFSISSPWDAVTFEQSILSDPRVRFSPRNGMPVFGLGLLELIPQEQILALEDPNDMNMDGISGRANWVFDAVKAQQGHPNPVSLGRFGWKASTPTVRQQSLGALRGDIGITNSLFPDESIAGTFLHDSYLSRTDYQDQGIDSLGQPEASDEFSNAVVFYAETLAVPARRSIHDKSVEAGAYLFSQIQCVQCHHPNFTTTESETVSIGGREAPMGLRGQTIWPFTDMLLHDMGEGLADNRRDFMANGREWKTRPLWGIGLTQTVNPQAGFLHDGRALTLEEAILWHGGEAEKSKNAFSELDKTKRDQLISFLRSL